MTVKHQPETPLPFSLDQVRPEPSKMYATIRAADRTIPIRVSGPNASQDAVYIVIAANAYPKLVAALRKVLETAEVHRSMLSKRGFDETPVEFDARALLRDLGETE